MITITALVLAGIGTSSVLAYVRRADTRALAGMKAVTVLVAQKSISEGTPADAAVQQGLLASQKLPASAVPADTVPAITPDLSSLVLSGTLQAGQLLLRPMLVTAAQTTSGMLIPQGMMAVTVRFCVPEAVADAVQAGSEVAVFDTVAAGAGGQVSAQPACDGPHQQPQASSAKTRVVLGRVQVLSVGVASGQSGSTTSTSASRTTSSASGQESELVTLAVAQADAEKLIQLTETGLPYLALLSPSSHTSPDAGRMLASFPAQSPAAAATQASQSPAPAATVVIEMPTSAAVAPLSSPTPAPGSAATGFAGPSSEHATRVSASQRGGRQRDADTVRPRG
jgi:pilus assembly protein CpaB